MIKVLAIDIETSPNLGYVWSLWNQNLSLSQLVETTEVMCFAARWVGSKKSEIMFFDNRDGMAPMLEAAWGLLDEADAVLSWNGQSFDSKHLAREFLLAGMTPPSPYAEIDLMRAVKKRFRFTSNKLDHVSQELGLRGKKNTGGFALWTSCMAGDDKAWKTMQTYNEQDVHLLLEAYVKLKPWIIGHPNVLLYGDRVANEADCPRCGAAGTLVKQGFRITQTGKNQRFKCSKCGSWSASGKSVARVNQRSVA